MVCGRFRGMELKLSGKKCLHRGNENQKEVSFLTSYQVILFRSRSIENIPLITSKIMELDLQSCGITNSHLNLISKFIHLKFLCLSDNFIDTLPSFFQSFVYLTFCDLSSNSFSHLASLEILPSLLSLKYLNLSQNPITKLAKYRSQISKFCPMLLALDFHIISDEERYPEICYFNGTKFKSCSRPLYLESFLRVSYPKQSSSHLLISHCSRLHSLQRLAAATSPLQILKRYCQKWMRYSGLQRYIPQLIRLQALIRRFIFHCRIHKAVQEVTLQNSELEHELRMIHYAYLSKFVIHIQRRWRLTRRLRKEYRSTLYLQSWWRRVIVYHRGCVQWLNRNQVRTLIFPTKFIEIVIGILEQLVIGSPEGSSTRTILERVIQNVIPVEQVVLVKSRRVFKQWNGNKTVRVEFLFLSLPKWRRMKREEVLFDEEEEGRKKMLEQQTFATEVPHTMKLKSWFFSPCLCYASKKQRRLLFLLKRRGCRLYRQGVLSPPLTAEASNNDTISLNRILWNSRGGGKEMEIGKGGRLHRVVRQTFLQHQQQKYSFWLKSFHLSQLNFPADQDSLIWKVYKRLRDEIFLNVEDAIPLYFSHQMRKQSSVIEIQRTWRGYLKRKQISPKFIEKIFMNRSTILLQRWWRYQNSIRRRFDLLAFIEKRCHDICDKRLYLDSLVFYRLLRVFHKPQQSPLFYFPEYRGIPLIDSKTGCVVYQPLINLSDQLNDHQQPLSMIKHCIPQWTSWAPSVQLSPVKSSSHLNNYHKVIKDLISSHCEISLEHFPVGNLNNSDTDPDFRVIELVFSSISEAKIRCAMLMLQTYDCVSRKCVSMMTRDFVKRKIREQRTNILAGPALNRNISPEIASCVIPPTANDFPMQLTSNETVPVEGQILLTDSVVSGWLFPHGLSLNTREMIRYRFLCESLSKRNTYNAKNEKREHVPKESTLSPTQETKYEQLREMIVQQLQPPLSYDSLRTHRLEAVQLHSPVKPIEKYSDVTFSSIDERLQRHLWDSSRIVSWCADFPEDQKSASNALDDQISYNNVDRVVASRLDLIQLSQYEKVMTLVSPKRPLSLFSSDVKSRSPSPPKGPAPVPEDEIQSPRSPRPLSPNNPRHQWEISHRKKIQEIRQKNFQTQEEHRKKEELLQQTKESQTHSQKQEQREGKQKVQEWKTKRSQSAHSNHLRQRDKQLREREERDLKAQERKVNQMKSVKEQKKSQRFHSIQKKEIQNAHAVLFAMARHGLKNSSHRKEDQELAEKRELIRQQVAQRHSKQKKTFHPQPPQHQSQASSHHTYQQSQIRPHSAVQYHRMISEFEDRENLQKEQEFKYQRASTPAAREAGGRRRRDQKEHDDIDNDSISSNDSDRDYSQESFPVTSHPNQVKISVGVVSVPDENTENTSLIDLGSPRGVPTTKLRQELFIKTFPSLRNQMEGEEDGDR
jgi:hypothetical protein